MDTEDLYKISFGGKLEKEATTCGDTARYLHDLVRKQYPETKDLIDNHCSKMYKLNQNGRSKEEKKNPFETERKTGIETIEIKNYSQYSRPVLIQCTHDDVVDLPDKDSLSFGNQDSAKRKRGKDKEDLQKTK